MVRLDAFHVLNKVEKIHDGHYCQVGTVVGQPQWQHHRWRFNFKFISGGTDHKVHLFWYGPPHALQDGDVWQLCLKLKPAPVASNWGEWDYHQWLMMHGIESIGYVVKSSRNRRISQTHVYGVTQWRRTLLDRINALALPAIVQGILSALTVGSHQTITQPQWLVFQRTGTNHLIAIAGLHLGVLTGLVMWLSRVLWLRIGGGLHWPVDRVVAVAGLSVSLLYSLMAHFSLPTQRAFIMLAIYLVTMMRRYHSVWYVRFAIAVLVVVLVDPFSIVSASFWLSFMSVLSIVYVCSGRLHPYQKWRQWLGLQSAIVVGLTPLTLYFFHQLSAIGVIANLISVPWVACVILPLCAAASLTAVFSASLSSSIFWLAGQLTAPMWWVLVKLSQQDWLIWHHTVTHIWVVCMAMLGALLVLMPYGLPGRWLGLYCWLPFVWYRPYAVPTEAMAVSMVQHQNQSAYIVQTSHHAAVFGHYGHRLERYMHTALRYFSLTSSTPLRCRRTQTYDWDGVRLTQTVNRRLGHACTLTLSLPCGHLAMDAAGLVYQSVCPVNKRSTIHLAVQPGVRLEVSLSGDYHLKKWRHGAHNLL